MNEALIEQYVAMWRRLDGMMHDDDTEEPEAEALRDEMDPVHYSMSRAEREEAERRISALSGE